MVSEVAGQTLFLDRAKTLESVLLPRLSACSILRLACTCTQLRDWLFALDASVLQVCSRCLLLSSWVIGTQALSSVTNAGHQGS